MLSIAMLSYHTCPLATLGGKDTGGMNVYVRELTAQLGHMGIHVDVFTRSQDEHVPHVLHHLGHGNRVVHVPAGPEVPLPKPKLAEYLDNFVSGIVQFANQKSINYNLIHSHYWMSGLAAEKLKSLWGIKNIHMFHTLGEMKNRVARSEEEREGDYRLEGERRVISAADKLIVATIAERAQLEWLYHTDPRKMVVIPPGVDTCHFYPIPKDEAKEFIGIPTQDRMVLYVGRIEPLKGIDTLIKAMSRLRLKLDDEPVYLVVIGGETSFGKDAMTSEMNRLQKLCDELALGKLVVFLGKRSQETLPYYYSAADVLVMPSHYESFGMVALEAMACGTPVIASQVGGLAFLVQDGVTGYSIPDQDEFILCDRISRLLDDDTQRIEMGKRAVEIAQEYAWSIIADKVKTVYQEITD